ncbi:MAG TPA: DUF4845 domain-containing protein [Pseudoduganella sp.]
MQVKGLKQQAGISLVGLIVVLAILGFIGVIAMKIVPTYSEYRAINSAIVKAKSAGDSVKAIQDSFDRSAEVNYISTLHGRDLIIERVNGEMEVSFAYEKKIPLFGPASLLLEYAGSTSKNGPPVKNDQ